MEETNLQVEPRSVVGKKVRRLRAEGWIPAVLYGKDTPPVSLQIDEATWRQVFAGGGSRGMVTLKSKGKRKKQQALIREVQRDPISRRVLHVDFQQVLMTETLRTEVPVVVLGIPPVVERAEGVLITGLTQIEVECLPGNIPSHIEVDVSSIDALGQPITVADLPLPEGVTAVPDANEMVATVVALRREEEEEIEEEVLEGEEELEVIARGKEETEEAEEDEAEEDEEEKE